MLLLKPVSVWGRLRRWARLRAGMDVRVGFAEMERFWREELFKVVQRALFALWRHENARWPRRDNRPGRGMI